MERRLEVLGGAALLSGGGAVDLRARKPLAMLGLLAAARRGTLGRGRLASLLWEEADAEAARTSLRQALAQIRRAGGEGWVEPRADAIALGPDVTTDLGAFGAALARGDDAEAARLHAGPFLDGLALRGTALEEAVRAERARLSGLAAGAMRREMERLAGRAEGAQMAHRLLGLDPLDEAAHRALMAWDAARGARGAALERHEALRRALRRDLAAEPEPETSALAARIRRGARPARAPEPDASEAGPDGAAEHILLAATEAEEGADWEDLRRAAEAAGGRWIDGGPGEGFAAFADDDLRAVAAAAISMAEAAGRALSLGLTAGGTERRDLARARRLAASADPGTALAEGEVALRLGLAAPDGRPVPLAPEGAAPRPALPLVGREAEVAQVASALGAAFADGSGIVVHLSGEAGIGKSRLLEEIVASRGGAALARAAFEPLAHGAGRLAQDLMAALPAAGGPAPSDPFDRAVRAWLSDDPLSPEEELRLSALSDAELRRRALAALSSAIEASAGTEGIVIAVEDCHWAPPGAAELLLDLSGRLAGIRAAFVLTERPGEAGLGRRLAARGRTRLVRLDLAPLAPEAAARLARLAAPDGSAIRAALDHAGGHPLFLLRLLEADWRAGPLPATVTGLVLEQIERLSPPEREALRRACILGARFDPADAAAIFPEAPEPRPRGDLLHRSGTELAFGHDLVRQAIYGDLPDGARRAWHGRAAAHFRRGDPIRWADHALLADDPAEASRAAMSAANALIARMRLTAAGGYVEAGLAAGAGGRGEPEAMAELHSCRAGIRRVRGDLRGALDDYRAAHAVALSDATRVAMLVRQALVLHRIDSGAEADRALDAAEALADACGLAGLGRAEIHEQRGNRAFVAGDAGECLRHHALGLAAAEVAGDPRGIARAHGGLGDAHLAAGRLRSAHAAFERALQAATAAGLGMVHQDYAFMRAYALLFAEPGPRVHVLADLAVEAGAGAGVDRAEMMALGTRAEMRLMALDLEGARRDVARIAELVERDPETRFAGDVIALRAWLALREGDADGARDALAPHLEAARASQYNGAVFLGLAAVCAPDAGARDALLDAGEARIEAGTLSCAAIWFRCFALEATARAGDAARGGRQAEALRRLSAEEPLGLVDLALRAAALRFGAPNPEAERALRRDLGAARLSGLGAILAGPAEPGR